MEEILKGIVKGNINKETKILKDQKGWIFGNFAEAPFKTDDFEIKWGVHSKGEIKKEIAKNEKARTFVILIRGRLSTTFYAETGEAVKEILLEKEGDCVLYEPNICHRWKFEEDSLTLTIRWPSVQGDQKPC